MPRIAIIDDHRPLVELLTKFCVSEKYQVEAALSGNEGLQLIRETLPDVVLLDLNLGDMTGIDLLRIAKAEGCTSRFVFITGHADVRTAVDAMKNGASEYLTKPLDLNELRGAIQEALDQRSQGTTGRKVILVYPKQQAVSAVG
ncbi:MAG: sigma-54-dependent Fis family transcriptional regulator [Verrucomicrobiaceae bacterium]|nr:sigma-54-dependent Fis family transcriptional regulator [Verrucomicrobiaceae bacterium]